MKAIQMIPAIFAGQVHKSSASTIVPWMNEDKRSQQNVKLMMIVMMCSWGDP